MDETFGCRDADRVAGVSPLDGHPHSLDAELLVLGLLHALRVEMVGEQATGRGDANGEAVLAARLFAAL